MSISNGFPSSTTKSAAKPFVMEPVTSDIPQITAAFTVMPASTALLDAPSSETHLHSPQAIANELLFCQASLPIFGRKLKKKRVV